MSRVSEGTQKQFYTPENEADRRRQREMSLTGRWGAILRTFVCHAKTFQLYHVASGEPLSNFNLGSKIIRFVC